MDDTNEFKSVQEKVSASLINTTRTVGQLFAEDIPFQRSLDSRTASILDKQNARLLSLTNSLFHSATSNTHLTAPRLEDVDDVENNWRDIVDVVDSLLEKADICLDEYTGVIKRQSTPQTDKAESNAPASANQPKRVSNSMRKSNETLAKPQRHFHRKVTNDETVPFKPLLKSKPHAVVSLEDSLETFSNHGSEQYKHPYQTEIEKLEYPQSILEASEPIPYQPFDSTTATWVDTPEKVTSMLEELKAAKEIAIDLEHHDSRSYVGLVSLMQISTREKDWIVDTLQPWREDLQVLNEVLADPRIVKVFHGAYMDIVWLQRDLGLYVVGLFDTYHACRALGYPQASLAYLLLRFIHFNADKQYQMADWRIRPLPEPMFNYARSDTHFLLFIFDNLRNELIEKSQRSPEPPNALQSTFFNSKDTSLQRFERYIHDAEGGSGAGGWHSMLSKANSQFSREQFSVFRAVHQWRDTVARHNDDSLNYVMPKHVLFSVAREMPEDLASLYKASHPITPLIRTRSTELLNVISKAKEEGMNGPELDEDDVFVVKELGGGRKRKQRPGEDRTGADQDGPSNGVSAEASGADMALEQDEIGIDVPEDDENPSKSSRRKAGSQAARRAQKKLDKKRRREAEQATQGNGAEGDSSTPFDYANAASILHSKRAVAEKPGAARPFDPYVKSADAPKGMPRARREMPGKTHTFKQ
ncbi:MAG: Carboxy-terminal domain (CTD) phosphatase [Chaenotheca gracillima]|nr:MAG: Carboxy-terminal domain (CTD) phosphatase [Chaenotheca gracillima]